MVRTALPASAPSHRSAPQLNAAVAAAAALRETAPHVAKTLRYPRGTVSAEAFAELARTTSTASLEPYGRRQAPPRTASESTLHPTHRERQALSATASTLPLGSEGSCHSCRTNRVTSSASNAELESLKQRNAQLERQIGSLLASHAVPAGRAMKDVVVDRIERIQDQNQLLRQHVATLEQRVATLQEALEERKLGELLAQEPGPDGGRLSATPRSAYMQQPDLRPSPSSSAIAARPSAPNMAGKELLEAAVSENGRLTAENRRLAAELDRALHAQKRVEALLQQEGGLEAENHRLVEENRRLADEGARHAQAHQKAEALLEHVQANCDKQTKRCEGRHANAIRRAKEQSLRKNDEKMALLQRKIAVMDSTIKEHTRREEAAVRFMAKEKAKALEEARKARYDPKPFERARAVKLNGDEAKEGVLTLVHSKRKANQGAVGYLTLTLSWSTKHALNLCCFCPDHRKIYFRNLEANGGRLDVCVHNGDPLQNIVFAERPAEGVYHIRVINSEPQLADRCDAVPFDVVVQVGGLVYALHSQWAADRAGSSGSMMDLCDLTLHAGTHWLTLDANTEQLGKVEGSAGLEEIDGRAVST